MQAEPAVAYGLNFGNFDCDLIDVPAMGWNVCFGSLAAATTETCGVRFTAESCHGCRRPERQLSVISGHRRRIYAYTP
jgi:hypothetical protein